MTDKEFLDRVSTVEIYTEILLGILRYTPVKNTSDEAAYIAEITKKMKFGSETDYLLYRACIDQIEDAQYAINEVYQKGLITNIESQGEMYLRLYGVLNAIYLQVGAIIDLLRLFNFPDQKKRRHRIKSLKVLELRNKIASHTTRYKSVETIGEVDFFKLAQATISKWGNSLLVVGKDSSEEVDLIPRMKEFTSLLEEYLDDIVEKELYTRKFREDLFEWLEFRHLYIRKYRKFSSSSGAQ